MTAGILSERRSVAPFGLFGGQSGEKGVNILLKSDGRVVNLGGKATVKLGAGEVIKILTPGAGGFGAPEDADNSSSVGVDAVRGTHAMDNKGKQGEDGPQVYQRGGSVHEYRMRQESA